MSEAEDQDQRRFEPTPKRIADFRKKGQIAFSKDLTQVLGLVGGAGVGLALADDVGHALLEYVRTALERVGTTSDAEALALASGTFVKAIVPTLLGAFAGVVLAGGVQLGSPPALQPLTLDLTRLANVGQLGELLSPKQQAIRAAKALAKLAVVGAAGVLVLEAAWAAFERAPTLEARPLLARIGETLGALMTYSGGALLGLAVLDYVLAKRRMHKRMMMTFDELKREMKEQEGNPEVKRKRRQRARELAKRRFDAAVKSADVVVVNPTEFAVALRYRSKKDKAPRVVAKGKGVLAERLRELARKYETPIVVNIPLARFLYRAVPEGREIPSTVYRAVAELLGFVYRIQRRRAA